MNKVNMSLDDIIKTNKDTRRNSNVGQRRRGNAFRKNDGQTRSRNRFNQKEGGRRNSFNNKNTVARRGGFRRHNDFNKNENSNGRGIKRGTLRNRLSNRRKFSKENPSTEDTTNFRRLFVSNLHKDIINSELKTIFSKIGTLKRCGIHWDVLGNSKGTADVEYERAEDAKAAMKEFNDIEIEGIPLKVVFSSKGRGAGRIVRRLGTRRSNGSFRNKRSNYNK